MKHAPNQYDQIAHTAALASGVRFIRLDDGPWAWNDGVTGNSGFPTELAAARDAMKERSSCQR